jgi:pyridoxal phosphate enzyme (YggS family)
VTVADGLREVRARIDRAARAAGRDPAAVQLVAVSKTKPPEALREAYAAGQRAFGESYAQELVAKADALKDLPGLEWHFIGHLQSNKAKAVAARAHVVHSVDSTFLAKELGKRASKERSTRLPVMIEVNVWGEPQKSGATPGDIAEVMAAVHAQASLELRGLMTVPPAGDPASARSVFETLFTLRNLHGGAAALPGLSMGMSDDLEIAVACGSTVVRVGTAIFGERTARTP